MAPVEVAGPLDPLEIAWTLLGKVWETVCNVSSALGKNYEWSAGHLDVMSEDLEVEVRELEALFEGPEESRVLRKSRENLSEALKVLKKSLEPLLTWTPSVMKEVPKAIKAVSPDDAARIAWFDEETLKAESAIMLSQAKCRSRLLEALQARNKAKQAEPGSAQSLGESLERLAGALLDHAKARDDYVSSVRSLALELDKVRVVSAVSDRSVQDRRSQIQAVIEVEESDLDPSDILTEPLKALAAANKLLSGDALEVLTKSRDAVDKAFRGLYDLPTKILNLSQPLEEGACLSEKEKNWQGCVEAGRLIQSSAFDPKIQERFLKSQVEALPYRAVSQMQLVSTRRAQNEAKMAIIRAWKAPEKTELAAKLAEGKEVNAERQERALRVYAEATKTVCEALGGHAGVLQRLAGVVKKYAKARGGYAEAIESVVTTQTKV